MIALKEINLSDVIFIDIETARSVAELQLDTPLFDSWEYSKRRNGESNEDLIASFKKEAGLFSEFGRIVCITVGRIKGDQLVMRTYNEEDERTLLSNFNDDLTLVYNDNPRTKFCGHAAIGFDIPFIFQRCLINQVEPHDLLDVSGKKPWEVTDTIIDTKVLWQGTSFKPASLINIAVAMGIPSPKDDISGAEVGDLYWSDEEGRIGRISRYCEKDVLTTANVVRKCRFESLLSMASPSEKIDPVKNAIIQKLFDGGRYLNTYKDKLLVYLRSLEPEDAKFVLEIMEASTSTARGKKTKFTKAHVKELREALANG
jgi:hypothetical protein